MITQKIPPTAVQIGGPAEKNCIEISVKNTESAETRVTVTVGCGSGWQDLLNNKNESVEAKYKLNSQEDLQDLSSDPDSDGGSWQVEEKAAQELTIILRAFECDTHPGTAQVDVHHQVMSPGGEWETASESRLEVNKELVVPKVTSELCYFRVDPDYILHAGSTKVAVSFLATGYQQAFLFRNNEEIEQEEWSEESADAGLATGDSGTDYNVSPKDCYSALTEGFKIHLTAAHANTISEPTLAYCGGDPKIITKNGRKPLADGDITTTRTQHFLFDGTYWVLQDPATDNVVMGYFCDAPSITSVYRLLLKRMLPGKAEESQEFWRTVQVISPGWNRLSLPQGSPTRLFVAAAGFRGGTTSALYGVFKHNRYKEPNEKTDLQSRAKLYLSTNGVDGWEDLGSLPDAMKGMETSPGVYYKSRLWVIGGSAVNPGAPDNYRSEIWCYQKEGGTDKWGWKKSDLQYPPKGDPRCGHSCVVFQNEIWVLGGFDNGGDPHQDIWRIKAVGDTFAWASEDAETAPWPARYLHSSAVVIAEGKQTLWVYGGTSGPGFAYTDLWRKLPDKGALWEKRLARGSQRAIVPDPGMPLGSALLAYFNGGEEDHQRLMLLGSFLEWTSDTLQEQQVAGNRISSFQFDWRAKTDTWESRPVSDGWQQFEGQNFSMQAIAFNGFIYVYTLDWKALHPKAGDKLVHLKLNIRIP